MSCLLVNKGLFCVLFLWLATNLPQCVTGRGAYMGAYFRRTNVTSVGAGSKEMPPTPESVHARFGPTILKDIDERYSRCNGVDIRELTIFDVQELFAINQLSSLVLTNCYLQRIYHMNAILRPVLEVNPNAVNEAYKADVERRFGKGSGSPLHGIPMFIKDHIGVKDHMHTSAGSWALFGLQPKKDADVVTALRKAGVVILGKTNLSEFSAFRGVPKNGWSGRGGQTLNAYNLNADPYGSSTGSAVSVTANLGMVSIGGETDGSLITPASVGGLCTLKPTLGKISTKGVIPISHNQDCLGPMARTMLDAALLFDAMLPKESKTAGACEGSYAQCLLRKDYFRKFRVGILRQPFWNTSIVSEKQLKIQLPHLEELLQSMQEMSSFFEIQDPVQSSFNTLLKLSSEKELTVLLHDFKAELNEYLRNNVVSNIPNIPEPYHQGPQHTRRIATLRDVIQYNNDHPDGETQALLIMAEATDGIHNKTYLEDKQNNQETARGVLTTALEKYNLDALLFPNPLTTSVQSVPLTNDESLQDLPLLGFQLAAIAGYPSVNVPAGMDPDGVPFGVTLIGAPHSEATLLQIGFLLEKLNPARRTPQFLL